MPDLFNDFSGSDYEGEQNSFPFIQLISKDEIERSGLFIAQETADRVEFQPDDTWTSFNMKYKSKDKPTPGYICQNPRFVVIARSRPTVWTKKPSEFVGVRPNTPYDKAIHILKTRYLLMLLGADNSLLTSSPLQFTTKGAFNGSFGAALSDYQSAFSAILAAHSVDKKPRGDKFFSMVVVQLSLKIEGRGDEDTACCVADKILAPTLENIRTLFLGEDVGMKDLLESYYTETKKFIAGFEGGNNAGEEAGADDWSAPSAPKSAKKGLASIEILPPSVLSPEEMTAKCVEIIQALGYDNEGAATFLKTIAGVPKLRLMNRETKELVLIELYRLATQG